MSDDQTNRTLKLVANNERPILSSTRGAEFSRQQVVEAFHNAFQMLGGVPRLVLWGNENYGEFAKLYAKLLPATSLQIGDNSKVVIMHSIPPTALDRHEGFENAIVVDHESHAVSSS